ncbi:MAG: RdgB/HAM1 family non-canonical purine NTP pyrophosphatase [Bacteroidota bacterium]
MNQLVFATNNANKVREIRAQLEDSYQFLSLADIGCHEDIPETAPTFEGNARLKSRHVYEGYGHDCFSEDTGLEVRALDWAPGVITARYAGPKRSAEDNMTKLLNALDGQKDRYARFHTVICLILGGQEHYFTGICPGSITLERAGDGGFGYDPIFIPEGETRTFAQMSDKEKLTFSHRAKAMTKLIEFLRENQ